jgi:hypothetical protein
VALAGTVKLSEFINLCTPVDRFNADAIITAEMVNLAQSNGIDPLGDTASLEAWYVDAAETVLGNVGWGAGIPDGATGIRAALTTVDNTTFMKVVGQQQFTVTGDATAMTGPITQLRGGVLPIGVPLEVIQALEPGEDFYMMEKTTDGAAGCSAATSMASIASEKSRATPTHTVAG